MKKIVFLSHTSRNSIFKVGSYHLSNALAVKGYEICYISAPLSLFHFFLFFNKDKRREIRNRLRYIMIKKDSYGIYNHTPLFFFPFIPNRIGSWFYHNFNLNLSFTKSQLRKHDFLKASGLFLDDLKLNKLVPIFYCKQLVYRATDIYKVMGPGFKQLEQIERKVVQLAKVLIVTSQPLKEMFQNSYNRDATILINGVDYNHFHNNCHKPPLYEKINSPIFVYVGSFDFRFDFNHLEFFQKRDDLTIILIGPCDNIEMIPKSKNIVYLGEKDYSELPGYLQHASVGILPLKRIEANHGRSPMKLYEFAAAGLPILSSRLREIERRKHDFVIFYDSYSTFNTQVELIRDKRQILSQAALVEAQKYSWKTIADMMITISGI
ncbi:glycosyltransferase [Leeuwenhoekiella sp. A16]|uniref:glycosyltransferase n=1 Tax=Leeuwenhoekiella sp. A16 TaxID=3141462 RepID=UPI003A804C52